MKLYDLVKKILQECPETRDSDNALEWEYMVRQGLVVNGSITKDMFLMTKPLETARRSKQDIQNSRHLFDKSPQVKKWTQEKAKQKGTHIFREVIYDDVTGTAREI